VLLQCWLRGLGECAGGLVLLEASIAEDNAAENVKGLGEVSSLVDLTGVLGAETLEDVDFAGELAWGLELDLTFFVRISVIFLPATE